MNKLEETCNEVIEVDMMETDLRLLLRDYEEVLDVGRLEADQYDEFLGEFKSPDEMIESLISNFVTKYKDRDSVEMFKVGVLGQPSMLFKNTKPATDLTIGKTYKGEIVKLEGGHDYVFVTNDTGRNGQYRIDRFEEVS